ncbi:MAG TPA: GAF domain-containing protein [Candidatus Sulfotelmatobacter sp.]|nr:GAF domain-containing protein [Candidatus Sulfotelmatobacter sp.]
MQSSPSREHAVSPAPPAPISIPFPVRFPGEDGGHSLAEMASRDLDAALQLLADRAQYITGATGAAIALRRRGKNDMLCRASTGSNAPELGALLSTEFGLSGESVRTRQALRCDDAERDVRVNREVCRQLGIASVVVMPVVNDEGVLGVFELFSGRVNAFGERDLSAVQRLSEMVETAVRLAEAAEKLPERLNVLGEIVGEPIQAGGTPAEAVPSELVLAPTVATATAPDPASSEQVLEEVALEGAVPEEEEVILEEPSTEPVVKGIAETRAEKTAPAVAAASAISGDARLIGSRVTLPTAAEFVATVEAVLTLQQPTVVSSSVPEQSISPAVREETEAPVTSKTVVPTPEATQVPAAEKVASAVPAGSVDGTAPSKTDVLGKKSLLFWSAALNPAADAEAGEADQSHVPPVLRSLQQCQACGFPVSAGRSLCVECEEKKWRGQLKVPPKQTTAPAVAPAKPRAEDGEVAATPFSAVPAVTASVQSGSAAVANSPQAAAAPVKKALKDAEVREIAAPSGNSAVATALQSSAPSASVPSPEPAETSTSNFVLSAGLEPSQSWLAANKYIIAVLLLVAMIVAGFFLLR